MLYRSTSPGGINHARNLFLAGLCAFLGWGGPLWPDLTKGTRAVGGGENDAALVVAIEDYSFLPDVKGAGEMGAAWVMYLRYARKVPNVLFLRNEGATINKIRKGLEEVAQLVRPGGRIWFVFIGHGAPSKDGKESLLVSVMAQADEIDFYPQALPRTEVVATLASSSASEPPILILDACFSGLAPSGETLLKGSQMVIPADYPERLGQYDATILTAGRSKDIAGPLPGGHGPAFSYPVLGALRGWGDRDGNHIVTAEEAVAYARDALMLLTPGRMQEPQLTGPEGPMTPSLSSTSIETGPDLGEIQLELSRRSSPGPVRTADRGEDAETIELQPDDLGSAAPESRASDSPSGRTGSQGHESRNSTGVRAETGESALLPALQSTFSERERLFLRLWGPSTIPALSESLLREFPPSLATQMRSCELERTDEKGLLELATQVRLRLLKQPRLSPEAFDYAIAILVAEARTISYGINLHDARQLIEAYKLTAEMPTMGRPDFSDVRKHVATYPAASLEPLTRLRLAECAAEDNDLAQATSLLRGLCSQSSVDRLGDDHASRALFLAAELSLKAGDRGEARRYLSLQRRYLSEPWRTFGLVWLLWIELEESQIPKAMKVYEEAAKTPWKDSEVWTEVEREVRHRVAQALAEQAAANAEPLYGELVAMASGIPGGIVALSRSLWYWMPMQGFVKLGMEIVDHSVGNSVSGSDCAAEVAGCRAGNGWCLPVWLACMRVSGSPGPRHPSSVDPPDGKMGPLQLKTEALLAAAKWFDEPCQEVKGWASDEEDCRTRAVGLASMALGDEMPPTSRCQAKWIVARNRFLLGRANEAFRIWREVANDERCAIELRRRAAENLVDRQLEVWELNHPAPFLPSEQDWESAPERIDSFALGALSGSDPLERQLRADCSTERALSAQSTGSEERDRLMAYLLLRNGEFEAARPFLARRGDREAAYLLLLAGRAQGAQALTRYWSEVEGWADEETLLSICIRHSEWLVENDIGHGEQAALFLYTRYEELARLVEDDSCARIRVWEKAASLASQPGMQERALGLWAKLAPEIYVGQYLQDCVDAGWKLIPVLMNAAIVTRNLDAMGDFLQSAFALSDGNPDAEGYALQALADLSQALGTLRPDLSDALGRILEAELAWRCAAPRPSSKIRPLGSAVGSAQLIEDWIKAASPDREGYAAAAATMRRACVEDRRASFESTSPPLHLVRSATRRSIASAVGGESVSPIFGHLLAGYAEGATDEASNWEASRINLDLLVFLAASAWTMPGCFQWRFYVPGMSALLERLNEMHQSRTVQKPPELAPYGALDLLAPQLRGRHSDEGERISAEAVSCLLKEQGREAEAREIQVRYSLGTGAVLTFSPFSGSDAHRDALEWDTLRVRKIIRANLNDRQASLGRCFRSAASENPRLTSGSYRFTYTLTVSETGPSIDLRLVEDSIGHGPMVDCVSQILRGAFTSGLGTEHVVFSFSCTIRFPLSSAPPVAVPPTPISFCLSHKQHLYSGTPNADWLYLLQCAHRFDSRAQWRQVHLKDLTEVALNALAEHWDAGPLELLFPRSP